MERELIGTTLGGFVLQSQLGRGGMGVVFRAHDPRLDRHVAVKVLPEKFRDDATIRERFLREGRSAAKIDHPNVVKILSAGEENGVPYLVMEYVEGGTLESVLEKRGKLPPAAATRIARQLASALAAAHRAGVLHRDIKSANVLFTRDGQPKLTDFGLAREEDSNVHLSQTGVLMGTPHYMSPEVCQGGKADARSDVYSLGVLTYLMLSGRKPFDGESVMSILLAHIQAPLPPLPEAPDWMGPIVEKALARDPGRRWATASEFELAVEAGMSGSGGPASGSRPPAPVPAARAPAPPTEPAVPPTPGRRFPVVPAAVGGGAALLLGVALLLYALKDPPVSPDPSRPAGGSEPDPGRPPEDPPVDDGAARQWKEALEETRRKAGDLESRDEWLAALAEWELLEKKASGLDAKLELQRGRKAVMDRAKQRAESAALNAGPKDDAALQTLLEKLPAELRRTIEDARARLEVPWAPRDGVEKLGRLVRGKSPREGKAELARIRAETPAGSEEVLRRAEEMLQAWSDVAERAIHHWERTGGATVVIRRSDGTPVRGSVKSASVFEETLRIASPEASPPLVTLHLREIHPTDIAEAALAGIPDEGVFGPAVAYTFLCGDTPAAWRMYRRAQLRRATIGERMQRIIENSLPKEAREALRDLERRAESADRSDRLAEAAKLAREALSRFVDAPTDPGTIRDLRRVACQAPRAAAAEDLRILTGAVVSEEGGRIRLDFPISDLLLHDWIPTPECRIVPDDCLTLVPTRDISIVYLPGIAWDDPEVTIEFRSAGLVGILCDDRGWERIGSAWVPGEGGTARLGFPMDEWVEVPPSRNAWRTFTLNRTGNVLTSACDGVSHSVELPLKWDGFVALLITQTTSIRSFAVSGIPTLRAYTPREPLDDASGEFGPIEKAHDLADPEDDIDLGTWVEPRQKEGTLTLECADGEAVAGPPEWKWGDDYIVEFEAKWQGPPESSLLLNARMSDEAHRLFSISTDSRNGFVVGSQYVETGSFLNIKPDRWYAFEVTVRGDLIAVDIDEKDAFNGHLGPARTGGIRLGVRQGKAQFRDMIVRRIPRK
jgi:serine/threonine-protein kinase